MTKKRLGIYDGVEQRYISPFPIVNAALYDLISTALDGADIQHTQSPGFTSYTIPMTMTGLEVRINVVQVAENITVVRTRPYLDPGQTINDFLNNPVATKSLKAIYKMCEEYILQTMRYTYPELTLREIKGVTPPMPTPDQGLGALVAWKDKHLRGLSDQAFADQCNHSEQSIRNARNKSSDAKVQRGRIRKK